ncbi:MAG TPA: GrpB family protein [Phototrophicaceae bacterium]|uniref:GrpB family protein n=1 Tax=Oceanitalea stevensii TaxID=2763072 RepID=A0ABR8Z0M2_9MICO|nr:GrpB family protein [Oceanitalea stevensii]MBD8061882.1 GrpB family protein [Oceanitalea stevensii]HLT84438.1 GrpB family protein [Phototrophicaceae bacterium]
MDAEQQTVRLVPSRHEEWRLRYTEAAARLAVLLPGAHLEHIGSTAVPGLPAKDVVDVLVGVDAADVVEVAHLLRDAGLDLEGALVHHCWLSAPDRRARTVVVHVVEHGGRAWTRRLTFRDLLRRDADARQRYLRVKEAAARDSVGWDDYTQAKTQVVADLLSRA